MKERSDLRPEETICLCGESDGTVFKRTFTIVQKISEGASCVCYEAYYDNSGRGVLKEFYPQEAYALERDQHGQLVHSAEFRDAYERFRDAEKKYIEPYEMLLDAKQNSNNQDLATFIPAFEIYHGCDETGNAIGTVYVWTPDPKLETFDKICDKIHKCPESRPEHKLFTVLTAIKSLTECICALHSADMIHRDIKPSNFGFVKRGTETQTQALSMFDINSVCSVYGESDGVFGTEGYMEPEAGYEVADNKTDIYSIGATLFHGIVVSQEVEEDGYLYRPDYYNRLHEMVAGSRLIRASEANSHPMLIHILTGILQKCLCERTYRYSNCEELLADIGNALFYVLPSNIASKSRSGEKWILADIEKSLDINREKNSSLAIKYHLYEHPLYRCVPNGETSLNVLVIGCGSYGQKFLDACLQAGQILGKELNVTVLSDNVDNKMSYIEARPELDEFFNIDGSLADSEDIYGNLTFENEILKYEDSADHAKLLEKIESIRCKQGNKHPHYIFIALGEDALNLAVARVYKTLEKNCIVSYVCERDKAFDPSGGIETSEETIDADSGLLPLYINAYIKQSAVYPEIERMAFNTHLVWEKNLNIDYRLIKADFEKNYNHDACVSNVLSIKYKLYSMGIDLDMASSDEAALQFQKILTDKKNKNIKAELAWIEHRRWVTEKLCLGWRRIRELEECAEGVTRDAERKRHVCIVRSRPDSKLVYGKYDYRVWDTASSSELSRLDELDRMSVELHHMFVKKAESVRGQNLLSGDNMAGIRTLIEGDKKAVVAFLEWFACLKDIWNRDREKVRLYKGLKTAFLNAADNLSTEKRKSVREQVKAFEAVFYPVLASMEYRDWKQDDMTLIDNIPFVLTYTENAYMVIPYATGDNTDVFGNVAAPTVASPARILYLYLVEQEQDMRELQKSLPYVIGYMKKKQLKATVEFILIHTDMIEEMDKGDYEREIFRLGDGRIEQVKLIKMNGTEDSPGADLKKYLRQRSRGKRVFAVEKNRTRLSYMLQGAGFYNIFSNYQFASENMRFHDCIGCDMLRCIQKKPYITVADIAAFQLSFSETDNQPEFFDDYKELWNRYCAESGVWKSLCTVLGKYAESNDVLVSFSKMGQGNMSTAIPQKYRYILPAVCKKSIVKIVRFLKEQDLVEEESYVNGYTTDSCEVVIADRCNNRAEYNRLFSNVYALMLSDAVSFHLNTKTHMVNVVFDNLVVSEVWIAEKMVDRLKGLMEYFVGKGYVINFETSADGKNEKWSFTFASRQIKGLLTNAGKMLEIYTYHKIKEHGTFDDVVGNCIISWGGTAAKSEFDCILTKGFRTLFVECKAQSDINQEFYYKVASLTEQFGINATAVLIADTQEQSWYDQAPVNAMQRKRGSMMDVVTIWKHAEINNIGSILQNIIDGKYVNKEE